MKIPKITATKIIEQYSVILLDSYGVLLTQNTAIPEANTFIKKLNEYNKPYYVVTNDASKSLESSSRRFKENDIDIEVEHIITSGSLLKNYFQKENLIGLNCGVIGPEDSFGYIEEAGGNIVPIEYSADIDVLVVCDEAGFPFLEMLDTSLSMLFNLLDTGKDIKLVSPNPDLIYPKDKNTFGFTSQAIVLILEAALRHRYPGNEKLTFTSLGKPYHHIFEEAYKRSGTKDMVMIGDQIPTDIKGANDFGIDSVLVGTGLTNIKTLSKLHTIHPKYVLDSLKL